MSLSDRASPPQKLWRCRQAAYSDSLSAIGAVWRKTIGKNFPAMAVVGVTRLVEPAALVEIETTAVIPD